jgi:hypothetical protein
VAFDPSPLQSFEGAATATTPVAAALWDWLWLELRKSGPAPLLVALVLLFGGIQLRRLWIARRCADTRVAQTVSAPAFVCGLLEQLRKRGFHRSEEETLEALARRLRQARGSAPPLCDAAGELLARTAALRYGGQGDPEALERDILDWVAQDERASGTPAA